MSQSSLNRRVKRTNRKQGRTNRKQGRTNRKQDRTNRKQNNRRVKRTNRRQDRTNRKQNNRRVKRTSRNMYKVGGMFHRTRTSPSRGSNQPVQTKRVLSKKELYQVAIQTYKRNWKDYCLVRIELEILNVRHGNIKWGFKNWRRKKLQAKIDNLEDAVVRSRREVNASWAKLCQAYEDFNCEYLTVERGNELMINLRDDGSEGLNRQEWERASLKSAAKYAYSIFNKSDMKKLPDFDEFLDDLRSEVNRGNVLSTRDPTPTQPLGKQTRTQLNTVEAFKSTAQTQRNKRGVGKTLEEFMKQQGLDFEFTTWRVSNDITDDWAFLTHYTDNKHTHEQTVNKKSGRKDYLSWIERVTIDHMKRRELTMPTARGRYNTPDITDMRGVGDVKGVWDTFSRLAPTLNLQIPFFMDLRIFTDKDYINAVRSFTKHVNEQYHKMYENINQNTTRLDLLLSQHGAIMGVNIETIKNDPKYKKLNQRITDLINAQTQLLALQEKTDSKQNDFLKIIQFGIANSTITVSEHGKPDIVYYSGVDESGDQLPGQVPGRLYAP